MHELENGFFGGWLKAPHDPNDFKYTLRSIPADLPVKADIFKYVPKVFDQQTISSCTANAGVCALMCIDKLEGETSTMWSRLFLYYNERVLEGNARSDSGAYIKDVFKAANSTGVCDEITYPYVVSKVTKKPTAAAYKKATQKAVTYELLPQTIASVKDCIANNYPIIFGFTVYKSFMTIKADGIMPMPKHGEQVLGGHACAIIAYDDTKQLLTVRNSWGDAWGDKGNFYMPYSFFESNDCSDSWTLKKTN